MITNYQVLNELKIEENQFQQEQSQFNHEFYQRQQLQEQNHEVSQIEQLKVRVKELENLLGNNISYLSFVVSQQIKTYQSKKGKLFQSDKEHLESCELLLNQFKQQSRELKTQGITTHIFKPY